VKDDSNRLMQFAAAHHGGPHKPAKDVPFLDAISAKLGIGEERAEEICDEWYDNDWWDFGVSMRSGWFTDKGWRVVIDMALAAGKEPPPT